MNHLKEDADVVATLALVRSMGLPGYTATDGSGPSPVSATEPDAAIGVLSLVRTAGLAGYDPGKIDASLAASARPTPSVETGGAAGSPVPPSARLTKQQFLILTIAPGSEAALGALEGRMEHAFAADNGGKPYWVEASASGGASRAFMFTGIQMSAFADLLRPLGSGLSLSVGPIDLSSFEAKGPGATGRRAGNEPPQLPLSLPDALRVALRA